MPRQNTVSQADSQAFAASGVSFNWFLAGHTRSMALLALRRHPWRLPPQPSDQVFAVGGANILGSFFTSFALCPRPLGRSKWMRTAWSPDAPRISSSGVRVRDIFASVPRGIAATGIHARPHCTSEGDVRARLRTACTLSMIPVLPVASFAARAPAEGSDQVSPVPRGAPDDTFMQ